MVDRVSTNVPRHSVSVVVKFEDMIIQSHLWWYGQAIHGDINSQIHEVMEVEINEKKKKCQPKTSCEECIKKDLELDGLRRDDAYNRKQWRERIRAKTVNPDQLG